MALRVRVEVYSLVSSTKVTHAWLVLPRVHSSPAFDSKYNRRPYCVGSAFVTPVQLLCVQAFLAQRRSWAPRFSVVEIQFTPAGNARPVRLPGIERDCYIFNSCSARETAPGNGRDREYVFSRHTKPTIHMHRPRQPATDPAYLGRPTLSEDRVRSPSAASSPWVPTPSCERRKICPRCWGARSRQHEGRRRREERLGALVDEERVGGATWGAFFPKARGNAFPSTNPGGREEEKRSPRIVYIGNGSRKTRETREKAFHVGWVEGDSPPAPCLPLVLLY